MSFRHRVYRCVICSSTSFYEAKYSRGKRISAKGPFAERQSFLGTFSKGHCYLYSMRFLLFPKELHWNIIFKGMVVLMDGFSAQHHRCSVRFKCENATKLEQCENDQLFRKANDPVRSYSNRNHALLLFSYRFMNVSAVTMTLLRRCTEIFEASACRINTDLMKTFE